MPTDELMQYRDASLTSTQQRDLQNLVAAMPSILSQAESDYVKYLAGRNLGLFVLGSSDSKTVSGWFADFPRFWQTIRANFEVQEGVPYSPRYAATLARGDAFTQKLGVDPVLSNSLGFLPVIVIVGVLILAAFGIAGAIWAIGYYKKQANVSKVIEQVTAGKLPASVLNTALEASKESSSLFGDISGVLKWGVIAAVVYMAWPIVSGIFKGRQRAEG